MSHVIPSSRCCCRIGQDAWAALPLEQLERVFSKHEDAGRSKPLPGVLGSTLKGIVLSRVAWESGPEILERAGDAY